MAFLLFLVLLNVLLLCHGYLKEFPNARIETKERLGCRSSQDWGLLCHCECRPGLPFNQKFIPKMITPENEIEKPKQAFRFVLEQQIIRYQNTSSSHAESLWHCIYLLIFSIISWLTQRKSEKGKSDHLLCKASSEIFEADDKHVVYAHSKRDCFIYLWLLIFTLYKWSLSSLYFLPFFSLPSHSIKQHVKSSLILYVFWFDGPCEHELLWSMVNLI